MQWASKQKQPGFTIVELIVVIIVIAILATITVVTYRGVTNRANDTATMANVETLTDQIRSKAIRGDTNAPGYDSIAARTSLSANGTVVYSFEGLNDLDVTTSTGYRIVSNASFKSQYGYDVKGRSGYIALAVSTGVTNQYYLTAMGVGVYKDQSFVPAVNRVLRTSDPVLPNVSGWYLLTGTGMKVEANKVVCSNGTTPTASFGPTWNSVSVGLQPSVSVPLLNSNGKVTLGAAEMRVRRNSITCSGVGGGTGELYALVNSSTDTSGTYGYFGLYPMPETTIPYNR